MSVPSPSEVSPFFRWKKRSTCPDVSGGVGWLSDATAPPLGWFIAASGVPVELYVSVEPVPSLLGL
eukprot:657397-Prorocentrum_lima.AAC.1